ncbi:uncharacterized protein LOC116297574 [Actinia tenebrosa]|uniref:Uncharacterized protein LOC116297574 n=1 Tax=Actinia tenebrosa TaxID=6105 RepID=A0A6P8I1N1_ACTTE|nr:uncharacterized protein LOC116297574 [Actinia tenebrosa]
MIEFLVHNNVNGICITKYDCSAPDQECCMNQCVGDNNCFGMKCSLDSQCGYSETCCRGSCTGHCDIPLPLILGCVITAIFLISLIVGAVWLYRRRTRSHQLQRRPLVPYSGNSRAATANPRHFYYGGTQQPHLLPCTPSTTYHQGNPQSIDSQFGPASTTYLVPDESRHPSQECHTVPLRGAIAMATEQPPPYASYEQVTEDNKEQTK